MTPPPAPFFDDIAEAPEGTRCVWLNTRDGIRIRAAHWPGGARGTVLIFPGRSEYIEKYGPAAGDLAARGYATATVDWRGQGLADRLLADRALGHVGAFCDYQKDVAALFDFAGAENLPRPWYVIAHSMGGCIALRALHDGLPVRAVAFSAPMWGIRMMPVLRPVARAVSTLAACIGMADRLVPGTSAQTYVLETPFEENVLTRDADMYAFMRRQQGEHPELAIGGPTLRWMGKLASRGAGRNPCADADAGTADSGHHISRPPRKGDRCRGNSPAHGPLAQGAVRGHRRGGTRTDDGQPGNPRAVLRQGHGMFPKSTWRFALTRDAWLPPDLGKASAPVDDARVTA